MAKKEKRLQDTTLGMVVQSNTSVDFFFAIDAREFQVILPVSLGIFQMGGMNVSHAFSSFASAVALLNY